MTSFFPMSWEIENLPVACVPIETFPVSVADGIIELINLDNSKSSKQAVIQVDLEQELNEQACVIIAAQRSEGSTKNCFNGKIEGPEIYADEQSIALWDFSKNTSRNFQDII